MKHLWFFYLGFPIFKFSAYTTMGKYVTRWQWFYNKLMLNLSKGYELFVDFFQQALTFELQNPSHTDAYLSIQWNVELAQTFFTLNILGRKVPHNIVP